ncbi:hypothetical protein DY000_02047965 [Brassica cretica]|uniref:Uncharacterized protein n=1 Tax=Brassica cretica TaxID=69181 RepID=A0ABQ7F4A3_BRACR|nr:hypothetical protein DY000_02047965 [Brassica cretica]
MSNTNQNRRPSFTSSTESSMRKRHGPSSSSVKPISNTAVMAKKRAPLGNITNQKNESQIPNSSVDFVLTNSRAVGSSVEWLITGRLVNDWGSLETCLFVTYSCGDGRLTD